MKVKLAIGENSWYLIAEDGQVRKFDCWEWPEFARKLGWIPRTVLATIFAADWFLIMHTSQSFNDPGYFKERGKNENLSRTGTIT